MLPYALGVGVLCLAVLGYRYVTGHKAPILIGLTAVLLLAGGVVEYRWRAQQSRLTEAVRTLLDRRDAYVHCERLTATIFNLGHEGYVAYNPDGSLPRRADLSYTTCRNIGKWQRGGHKATAPRDQMVAVHVLTHEAMHLAGVKSEATAECWAMQRDAQVAESLGASALQATALADRYWREYYPHIQADYRSSDCVPGGALDLHPETTDWPTG